MEMEKEERLTVDARAFNPVFIQSDSTIAYLATFDGGQNKVLMQMCLTQPTGYYIQSYFQNN